MAGKVRVAKWGGRELLSVGIAFVDAAGAYPIPDSPVFVSRTVSVSVFSGFLLALARRLGRQERKKCAILSGARGLRDGAAARKEKKKSRAASKTQTHVISRNSVGPNFANSSHPTLPTTV